MADTFFISDLHLGHDNVLKFAGDFRNNPATIEEHDEWLVNNWNSVVKRNSVVYVLGDVCWKDDSLPLLRRMRGQKILVRGNHDKTNCRHLADYFQDVHGLLVKGPYWLSHCPIHPEELRGRQNIHGHVHMNVLDDPRYISVCIESCGGVPVNYEEIQAGRYTGALNLR